MNDHRGDENVPSLTNEGELFLLKDTRAIRATPSELASNKGCSRTARRNGNKDGAKKADSEKSTQISPMSTSGEGVD